MFDLTAIYRDHSKSVFRFLRSRGIPTDQAEDLTQQTFLKVSEAPHSAGWKTYLCSIAWRLWIDQTRKNAREIARNRGFSNRPQTEMACPENAQILRDLQSKLTPVQSEIVDMITRGHKEPQICESLEIKGATYRSHMRYIRERVATL